MLQARESLTSCAQTLPRHQMHPAHLLARRNLPLRWSITGMTDSKLMLYRGPLRQSSSTRPSRAHCSRKLWKRSPKGINGCGIIYCRTRDACAAVANRLTRLGLPSEAYHAGLKSSQRLQVQNDWVDGRTPVIVATVSFGMGVDKATVRFVAHFNIAKSMAGYYQESGRAGRDGRPASCRLYYSRDERNQVAYLITQEMAKAKSKEEQRSGASNGSVINKHGKASLQSFESLVKFCEEEKCRHLAMSDFFGDSPPNCSGSCDVCKSPAEVSRQLEYLKRGVLANSKKKTDRSGRTCIMEDTKGKVDKDLYGEGRYGADSYYDGRYKAKDDSSDSDGDDDDKAAARERTNMIKAEFERRKKNQSKPAETDFVKPDEDCPLRDAANSKIPGLTVKSREHCLQLIEKALRDNFEQFFKNNSNRLMASEWESHGQAIVAEHEIFKISRRSNMYKAKILSLVSNIKKATKEADIHEIFLKGNKEKTEDSAANVQLDNQEVLSAATNQTDEASTSNNKLFVGFQTVSSLLAAPRQASSKKGDPGAGTPSRLEEESYRNLDPTSPHKSGFQTVSSLVSQGVWAGSDSKPKVGNGKRVQNSQSNLAGCSSGLLKMTARAEALHKDKSSVWVPSGDSSGPTATRDGLKDNQGYYAPGCNEKSNEACDTIDGRMKPLFADSEHPSNVPDTCPRDLTVNHADAASGDCLDDDISAAPHPTSTGTCILNAAAERCKDRPELTKECVSDHSGRGCPSMEPTEGTSVSYHPSISGHDLKISNRKRTSNSALKHPNSSKRPKLSSQDDQTAAKNNSGSSSSDESKPKRTVTFDPGTVDNEKSREDGGDQKGSKVKDVRRLAADVVVKLLTPYYKDNKFGSKDLFKMLAKRLAHQITLDGALTKRPLKDKAKKLVKDYFKKHALCNQESDLPSAPLHQ
ncbi:ATP-dependent DNA helicase Q5-like isoform X2 [Acanthaster planci]|uniref:DNA 3'-5' helicase n=1 Tax=Acanthaster planci TaxID=133434 RepID=A0A8B7YMX6_ACAPL|nr:ATP-dependent DNA helicase Q5-like isoform X2 [Acanthaster planci]